MVKAKDGEVVNQSFKLIIKSFKQLCEVGGRVRVHWLRSGCVNTFHNFIKY